MPVHHYVDDRHLIERGLHNYWGYNTLAFFAPQLRYASNAVAAEIGARIQDDGPGACTPPASR